MSLNVFEFDDYKQFCKAKIKENAAVRGYQTKLATAAKCHRSYFSQFLSSKQHLSSEQIMRLAAYWGFNATETHYIIELGNLSKTSYPPLQNMIKENLKTLQQQNLNLATRYKKTEQLDNVHAMPFYSSWHYSALHLLTGMNTNYTVEMLAQRLQLSPNLVASSLKTLETMGLVSSKGSCWSAKPFNIHVTKDSPLCPINHSNWRQRGVLASQSPNEGLHYTCIQSHAVEAFEQIKEVLLTAVDKTRKIIEPSPNEEATCICLDYFKI